MAFVFILNTGFPLVLIAQAYKHYKGLWFRTAAVVNRIPLLIRLEWGILYEKKLPLGINGEIKRSL